MLDPQLKSQINELRNTFRSGGISNPLTAIEQISYIIFMKRLDELDKQGILKAKRLSSFVYTSQFAGEIEINNKTYDKEKMRRSHRSQLIPEEMFPFVRDVVFTFIKNLDNGDGFAWSLKDASFLIPKPSMLVTAVKIIENLHITEQNDDTSGDIYEYLLGELSTAGKSWQFRTPRHIIQAMVEIINPTIHDKICDPSCGTAGFLIDSYKYIIKQNTSKDGIIKDDYGTEHYSANLLSEDDRKKLKTEALNWYDFDSTMVRIASMNWIMHGITNPNVKYTDTLWKWYDHSPEFDVILANPPFKWSIDASDIHDEFTLSTKKTELLFLELIYQKLMIWWKCGVIIPDGVLFGSSNAHRKIRELLVENTGLRAVISLPSWVFKPYAGVSTAILIFTKWDETNKVWFYDLQADWYSLDDKRNEISDNDIPDLIEKYKEIVLGKKLDQEPGKNDKWFWVKKDEIVENKYDLSISKYKKIVYESAVYQDPKVLIANIRKLENEIIQGMDELEKKI